MPVRPKRFEYAIAVDRDGRVSAEDTGHVDLDPVWTADHLLIAALARCIIQSFRYHADRAGLDALASAEASGVITRREEDGRYAFVELDCALEIELDPALDRDGTAQLIAKAERDCFVGASLTVAPRYTWRVNGNVVS